jgi:hypothetical protein
MQASSGDLIALYSNVNAARVEEELPKENRDLEY